MTKSLGGSSALSALAASTVISGSGNHHSGKTAENGTGSSSGNGMVDMSKSLASFHLSSSNSAGGVGGANGNNQTSNSTRNRAMDESVDHLFKEGKEILLLQRKILHFFQKVHRVRFFENCVNFCNAVNLDLKKNCDTYIKVQETELWMIHYIIYVFKKGKEILIFSNELC